MSNESKPGRVTPEPVKRERKRSDGQHKLKKLASGTNGSHDQSDASSTDKSLSKPEPKSLRTGHQQKGNGAIASDDTFVVELDASTNRVTVNRPIFGTNNQDSNHALVKQLFSVVPNAAGNLDMQNLKYALATIHGI